MESGPAGEVDPASRPAGAEPSTLGRLLDSGLLACAAAQVAARLEAEPGQPLLWRRLGDLYRQAGELERAAGAYEQLRALGQADPVVEQLLAILRGELPPRAPTAWPARFLRYESFLPPERLDDLLTFTARQRGEFARTPVMRDGRSMLRPEVRWCDYIGAIEPVARWFEPLIAARLPEFAARLTAPPTCFAIRDCKINRYGDGSYFRPHADRGPGAESRVFGFIYYFYFPPKRFTGGELAIFDRDPETGEATSTCTTVPPEQNHLVVLPSHCWHEVLPVRCDGDGWDAARFTLNGWIHRVG